jgi:hypothetical protein
VHHVASLRDAPNSSHASTHGDFPNRPFNLAALIAVQQTVKLRRGFKHEGHTPLDVCQVGEGKVAKTNRASVLDGTARH